VFHWNEKHTVLVASIGGAIFLLASHWLLIENISHRVHGPVTAINMVLQVFGSLFAGFASLLILIATFAGKISRYAGIISALLLGLTAYYCFSNSFGIIVSL